MVSAPCAPRIDWPHLSDKDWCPTTIGTLAPRTNLGVADAPMRQLPSFLTSRCFTSEALLETRDVVIHITNVLDGCPLLSPNGDHAPVQLQHSTRA
jgi:hypothetical protein